MWIAFLQHPRGAYYRRLMELMGTGVAPTPSDTCDSFLQFVMWPGPIDIDMPTGEIWGSEEQARALDLLQQLKEDQPPGGVRDAHIRKILGEMHILRVNHNKQWGIDDDDDHRCRDPAAWWAYN